VITGSIENNVRLPAGKFEPALKQLIQRLTFKLLAMVKAEKLSGQVLNVKTGKLRRSINAKFENSGNTGTVGTNLIYAKVHENGGPIEIGAHMRMMKQAFGKPVKVPREIPISAHIANFPEKSFLRSALKDLEPKIQPAVDRMVKKVLKDQEYK
jgi:phage gpG-like protein